MKNLPRHVHCPDNWEEVVGAFEQELFRQGKSEITIKNYGSAIRRFGAYCMAQEKGLFVSRLTETDVFAYVDYLQRDQLRTVPTG